MRDAREQRLAVARIEHDVMTLRAEERAARCSDHVLRSLDAWRSRSPCAWRCRADACIDRARYWRVEGL